MPDVVILVPCDKSAGLDPVVRAALACGEARPLPHRPGYLLGAWPESDATARLALVRDSPDWAGLPITDPVPLAYAVVARRTDQAARESWRALCGGLPARPVPTAGPWCAVRPLPGLLLDPEGSADWALDCVRAAARAWLDYRGGLA